MQMEHIVLGPVVLHLWNIEHREGDVERQSDREAGNIRIVM